MRRCPRCTNAVVYQPNSYQRVHGNTIHTYPGSFCNTCKELVQEGCPGFAEYESDLNKQIEAYNKEEDNHDCNCVYCDYRD